MSVQQDFATHIVDLLEPCGYCEARRKFTRIINRSLCLKTDAESREVFVTGDDGAHQLTCYLAADNFFKNNVACLGWGGQAIDATSLYPARHRKKKS